MKNEFSILLDKFKDLVTTSESQKQNRKLQENEQGQVLDELNDTIKEMDLLIKDLQQNLKTKESENYASGLEIIRLNSEVEFLQNRQDQLISENNIAKFEQVKMKAMQDEIDFLKEFNQKQARSKSEEMAKLRTKSEDTRYHITSE